MKSRQQIFELLHEILVTIRTLDDVVEIVHGRLASSAG